MEGGEAHTSNLCQKCYKETLKAKGEKPVINRQWREFAGQKAHRGRLWKIMGKEQYAREMWEYFAKKEIE